MNKRLGSLGVFTRPGLFLLISISTALVASYARPVIAAPPASEDIASRLAKTGDAAAFDGAEAVVVLDDACVTVRPNGIATTERCRVVKILKESAIRTTNQRRKNCFKR